MSVAKNLDKWLALLQSSLNVRDIVTANRYLKVTNNDYSDIISFLNIESRIIGNIQAEELLRDREKIRVLEGDNLLNRVENINEQLNVIDDNVSVLRLTNELIHDLRSAKGWLESYLQFVNSLNSQDKVDYRVQLLALGTAILGRAVELCPYKTGLLRRSGIVIQKDDEVVVAFTVPYAIYVHECTGNYHIIGRAKFLEIAAQEFLPHNSVFIENWDNGGVAITITIDDLRR